MLGYSCPSARMTCALAAKIRSKSLAGRSMTCSPEEQAQRRRYEKLHPRAQSPVMLSTERHVCGCDYGANSWTTLIEAQRIAVLLELRPGKRLLDIGA